MSIAPSTPAQAAAQGLPDYAPQLTAFHVEFATELRAMVATLPLSEGDKVLEVATGDGQFAVWLSERVGKDGSVTAVDVSKAWLREARQAVQNEGCEDRVQLEKANATRLPYADETFDFVWCAQSLYSLPRLRTCLAEMQRVLKPGGYLAILENDSLHHLLLPWPVDLEIRVLAAELKALQQTASQPAKFYAGRWLSRLMRKTGFQRPQERSFAHTRQQPLSENALQYFKSYLDALRPRVQPYLSPRARQRLERLIDPADRRSFWQQPDFVAVCIDRVVWAQR